MRTPAVAPPLDHHDRDRAARTGQDSAARPMIRPPDEPDEPDEASRWPGAWPGAWAGLVGVVGCVVTLPPGTFWAPPFPLEPPPFPPWVPVLADEPEPEPGLATGTAETSAELGALPVEMVEQGHPEVVPGAVPQPGDRVAGGTLDQMGHVRRGAFGVKIQVGMTGHLH